MNTLTFLPRARSFLSRIVNSTRVTFALVALAVFCGLLTYGALTATTPSTLSNDRLILLLYVDVVVLLALFVVIGRRVARLLANRRQGVAGSRLQVRLVTAFTLMAALPVLVTTIFSAGLLYFGLHGWFDKQVRTAITESMAVAQAYLNEHQQLIKADVLAMGTDLERQAGELRTNPEALLSMMQTQSFMRNFNETAIVRINGEVLSQSGFLLPGIRPVNPDVLQQARDGDVLILPTKDDDRIKAVLPLPSYGDTYLYAARAVDPKVLGRVDSTRAAVQAYQGLANTADKMQMTVTMVYLLVAGLLMLSAVWFGLSLARRLSRPIAVLVTAADRLRAGDSGARVPILEQMDDFETLAIAFNRMGEELDAQRSTLLATNRNLDERRRFTETVLNNVSTSVLSIGAKDTILLSNPAARLLLGFETSDESIVGIMPDLQERLTAFRQSATAQQDYETMFSRKDGTRRKLLVRLTRDGGQNTGNITVTMDDITDLAAAQKSAAWQDVARRIAHEIKNPLTPIQLSAERLKRRYLDQMLDLKDREVFERCTETIVRHVDDIKEMVNAFATFARMPSAKPEKTDIGAVCHECFSLQQAANSDIEWAFHMPNAGKIMAMADQQLLRQAVTNLLQNAVDAVHESGRTPMKIGLHVDFYNKKAYIGVLDSGKGIADHIKDTILEPYVTTKSSGTGLGLAIVKRTIEEQGGNLLVMPPLGDIPAFSAMETYDGARFYITLGEAS